MFERKSARERAKSGGGGGARNRKSASRYSGDAAEQTAGGNAEAPLARAQPSVRFGMTNGEKLEFEREEREATVLRDLRVMRAQRAQEFCRTFPLGEQRVHFRDALADPALEKREENIFFALEIGVESAARVAREARDIFQARGLKSVAREDLFRGE